VSSYESAGRRQRLSRLHHHDPGGLLVVPLDHAIGAGPIVAGDGLDRLVGCLAEAGADAVVLHKGAVRRVRPDRFRDLSLVLHLNASTGRAADPDAKYPVATVAEALRAGADAVSVHVNVGSATEDRQIAHLAQVAGDCDRWGVPLMAMMYARGPAIDGRDPEVVAHAVAIAAELGADLVKTALPADETAIARIVGSSPVPILAAGGDPVLRPAPGATSDEKSPGVHGARAVEAALSAAVRAGAAGIAAGRVVFTAADPGAAVRRLATLVHGRTPAVVR